MQIDVGRVPLVNETTAHRTGTAVEILVIAPDGEIDIPVVETEFDVAGRMGEIEPDRAAVLLGCRCDSGHIEDLPREVLNPAEQNQRHPLPLLVEYRFDVFGSNRVLAVTWLVDHQCIAGVEAVMA